MTHKNFLPLLFYYLLPILFCCISGCTSDKQIVIEESLNTGSERWKAKIKGGFLKVGKASFGPFNTVSSVKLDSPKLKTHSGYKFSDFFFRHDEISKKRKTYKLDVSRDSDTASVLIYLWSTSINSSPGTFSIWRDETYDGHSEAEGEIFIDNDTLPCVFRIQSLPVSSGSLNYSQATSGTLICFNDTIKISCISNYTNGRKGFGNIVSKGISLDNKTGQMAALQFEENNYVWIRKDLPAQNQLAIATFFCALLGLKNL